MKTLEMEKKESILYELKKLMFEMYMECHKGLYVEGEEYDEEKSDLEWLRWQWEMERIVTCEDEWLYEMENEKPTLLHVID